MFMGPLGLAPRSWSKLSTVNQRSCDGCFWKHGRIVYYDYERTSTPAGISPNGNSFQTALLEPNRVSIGFQPCSLISRTWLIALTWDTTSQKAIAVTSIRDWLKYDPSLPRHSRSQPGILDCLLVQISQQHGCLCGKITLILALSGI
ncbi:unnamed protein product [Penicillium salamii]|nr:unnamed protein product [Penicillium salamii]CAG8350835.1 unnamed protein product [Penicillium salamii]